MQYRTKNSKLKPVPKISQKSTDLVPRLYNSDFWLIATAALLDPVTNAFNARLPQGMHASLGHFAQTLGDTLWRHIPEYFEKNVLQFADDLCVLTETYQEHWDVLAALFKGLDEDGWTLARSKAFMFQRSLRFLGLIVSSAGVEADGTTGVAKLYGDKSKVETILDLKKPRDLTELRSFMGACNFFRMFVPAFSLIAAPLVKLTKQGINIKEEWGSEQDEAFRKLKLAIATAGAVTPYDPSREVLIHRVFAML
jgi:hypothetical protein